MQSYVLATSLLLIAVIAAVFWWAIKSSAGNAPRPKPSGNAEAYRSGLFWLLAVVGVVIMFVTLRPWPYDAAASSDAVTVTASGSQWIWEINPHEVPVDRPVIFKVTSTDVNHGFGVYDPDGRILFQTQAMPGYVNQVRYVFTRPGRYRVLCMEYCGLVHHDMMVDIQVK